jgi:hypothetical protein
MAVISWFRDPNRPTAARSTRQGPPRRRAALAAGAALMVFGGYSRAQRRTTPEKCSGARRFLSLPHQSAIQKNLKKFGALSSRTGHWKQAAIETPNHRNPEQEIVMWFTSRLHNRQSAISRERRRADGFHRHRLAFQPTVAALEDRRLLSTLTVTNTWDSSKKKARCATRSPKRRRTTRSSLPPASTARPSR